MRPSAKPRSAFFESLPPAWPDSVEIEIARQLAHRNQCFVVLDDDPTGTQSLHGVSVLTRCSDEELAQELTRSSMFHLLTNSASLDAAGATELNREVGKALAHARQTTGRRISIGVRSDPALRGHFPQDVQALQSGLGSSFDGIILCPASPESGYYTIDDVQWVDEGDTLVPIADSKMGARFGITHSHLPSWIEAQSDGAIGADRVDSMGLDELRRGGPEHVASRLRRMNRDPHEVIIVNAAEDRDLEVFVSGLLTAEAEGLRFLYRTASPFVRVRAGIHRRSMCSADDLVGNSGAGGLVVVGSIRERTNEQLERALSMPGVVGIELPVVDVIDAGSRARTITRLLGELGEAMERGDDAVLYTSRTRLQDDGEPASSKISEVVSEALCEIVNRLPRAPRYLIAKGGITASDLVTRGLGARRVSALGQLLPGVPVWKLEKESRYPGLGFVIFPGDVGRPESLAVAMAILRGSSPQ